MNREWYESTYRDLKAGLLNAALHSAQIQGAAFEFKDKNGRETHLQWLDEWDVFIT